MSESRSEWRYRYHAAAIYLEQGANNENFYTHPQDRRAIPAYLMVHNACFFKVDLVGALVLLSLAFVEPPGVTARPLPVWVHASVELVCLFVMSVELGIKLQWLGARQFVAHRRTLLKTVVLVVMMIEVCVVLGRQKSHLRVTRALRPIFLVDSHYSYNFRRFVRQIFQSLPPILDMLLLLLAVMVLFSAMGYFLFSEVDAKYFGSPSRSFISLFVLLTTANNPDVMMPAYSADRWNALFFIAYLSIELYFLMNLLLAVVYDTFSLNEREKFRRLYLHRLDGCDRAFNTLVGESAALSFEHFVGTMRFFRPQTNLRDCYLLFRELGGDVDGCDAVARQHFYRLFDVISMRWRARAAAISTVARDGAVCSRAARALAGSTSCQSCGPSLCCAPSSPAARSKCFPVRSGCSASSAKTRRRSDTASSVCALWYIALMYLHHYVPAFMGLSGAYYWVSVGLVALFAAEALLKLVALGPSEYASSGWNIFEAAAVAVGGGGVALHGVHHAYANFIVLRSFGLFKLLQLKRRYRDIFNSVTMMMPRFFSAGVVLLIIYYSFAILGMEFFASYDMRDCCQNSTVAAAYAYSNKSSLHGYYYLNTFENILISFVTLWDLMVVNNWYIIMEGYASVAGQFSRLYFMTYYLTLMVVLTIVVTFILEGFLFRIQCSREGGADDVVNDRGYRSTRVAVERARLALLQSLRPSADEAAIAQVCQAFPSQTHSVRLTISLTQPFDHRLADYRKTTP